jgi:formiminotetrahydrofolate cyclodeaminase
MVCRLTIGKKKYLEAQMEIENVLKRSEDLRVQFISLIDEDTDAFDKVMAAYGLPKETEEQKTERTAEIQKALKTATLVPLKLTELCREAMELVKIVVEKGNQNSISDASVAALMLQAGCEGAALNVKINLGSISDSDFVEQTRMKLEHSSSALNTVATDIFATVAKQVI